MSGEELQGAVESILASPAFSQILGQLQGKSAEEEQKKPAVPAITPEMMQKLPQMMSALAPLVGGGGKSEKTDGGGKGGDEGEKRKKLLAALRPYLSDSRRGAVDQILKVTEMTDLLGTLGDMKPKS
jgi:hypothetical protein